MVQLSREVAKRWSRLIRCVLTVLRVAMEATRVAKQARALAETFPWLAAVNPMLRESASGSGAGSSTQAGYAQDTRSCKHASSRGHAEDPKKEYQGKMMPPELLRRDSNQSRARARAKAGAARLAWWPGPR